MININVNRFVSNVICFLHLAAARVQAILGQFMSLLVATADLACDQATVRDKNACGASPAVIQPQIMFDDVRLQLD